jgi:hypothetical protein
MHFFRGSEGGACGNAVCGNGVRTPARFTEGGKKSAQKETKEI